VSILDLAERLRAVPADVGAHMFNRLVTFRASAQVRWCLYVLILLAPGSFAVVPALWCLRRVRHAFSGRMPYILKRES
jgi:hypothetical protein